MRDAEELMTEIFKKTNPIAQFEKKIKDVFSKEVSKIAENLKEAINNRFTEVGPLIEETDEFKEFKKEIHGVTLAELYEDSKIDSFADKENKLLEAIGNILTVEVGAIVYPNKKKNLSFDFVDVKLPNFTVGSANGFSYILSNFSDYRRHFTPMYYNDYLNTYNYYEIKSVPYTYDSGDYSSYTGITKSPFYNYYVGDADSSDFESTKLALLNLLSIKKLTITPYVSMMVNKMEGSQAILPKVNSIDLFF